MRIILIFIVFLNCLQTAAQADFHFIDTIPSCKAVLNIEYKKRFENFNKTASGLTSAQKGITKEIYNEIQESFLDKIKNNTFICDEKVNPYLQGLMDEVLTRNGINKSGYKMLLSRNSDINAYNTGDGTVVVNYGLFLAVENEDELVFVISHEVGHQHLDHVKKDIEGFAKLSTSDEIVAKTKAIRAQKFGKASMATDLLKNITYQKYEVRRRKEIEADSLGLVFYKKTGRNLKAAISLLEKLDESDKEKDSLMVDDYKAIFEKNGFVVKQKYFDQEQTLFGKYDKDKRINTDSLKSHPDCITRISLIKKQLNDKFSGNDTASAGFSEIKKNCIYQNLLNLYSGERYGSSLYEALKLYRKEPDNMLLKNIIYLNLLKVKAARANYTINRYVPAHDNVSNTDSLNRFISFVSNIRMTDFDLIINNFKT